MNEQEDFIFNNPPTEINLIPEIANAFGKKVLFEDPKPKTAPFTPRCNFTYGGIMESYRPQPSSHNPKV